jgi:hypothetical protein
MNKLNQIKYYDPAGGNYQLEPQEMNSTDFSTP